MYRLAAVKRIYYLSMRWKNIPDKGRAIGRTNIETRVDPDEKRVFTFYPVKFHTIAIISSVADTRCLEFLTSNENLYPDDQQFVTVISF